MQPLPITIRRSPFGYIRILLYGLGASALTIGLAFWLQAQPGVLPIAIALLGLVGTVCVLATIVAVLVYDSARMELTEQGIAVTTLNSLFWSTSASCEWRDVQDVATSRAGLWGVILGTGTITIQTAGTNVNLVMTWVDTPESVQKIIDYYRGQLG